MDRADVPSGHPETNIKGTGVFLPRGTSYATSSHERHRAPSSSRGSTRGYTAATHGGSNCNTNTMQPATAHHAANSRAAAPDAAAARHPAAQRPSASRSSITSSITSTSSMQQSPSSTASRLPVMHHSHYACTPAHPGPLPAAAMNTQLQLVTRNCESPLHSWLACGGSSTYQVAEEFCTNLSGQFSAESLSQSSATGFSFRGFNEEGLGANSAGLHSSTPPELGSWSIRGRDQQQQQYPKPIGQPSHRFLAQAPPAPPARATSSSSSSSALGSSQMSRSGSDTFNRCFPGPSGPVTYRSAPQAAPAGRSLAPGTSPFALAGDVAAKHCSSSSSCSQEQLNAAGCSPPEYNSSSFNSLGMLGSSLGAAGKAVAARHAVAAQQGLLEEPIASAQLQGRSMPLAFGGGPAQQVQQQQMLYRSSSNSGSNSNSNNSLQFPAAQQQHCEQQQQLPNMLQRQGDILQAVDEELHQLLQLRKQVIASQAAAAAAPPPAASSAGFCAASSGGMQSLQLADNGRQWQLELEAVPSWAGSSEMLPVYTNTAGFFGSTSYSTALSARASTFMSLESLQLALSVEPGMIPCGLDAGPNHWMDQQHHSEPALSSALPGVDLSRESLCATTEEKLQKLATIQQMQHALEAELLQLLP